MKGRIKLEEEDVRWGWRVQREMKGAYDLGGEGIGRKRETSTTAVWRGS